MLLLCLYQLYAHIQCDESLGMRDIYRARYGKIDIIG